MALSTDQLKRIREVIRKHHLAVTYQIAGDEPLTENELVAVQELGIDPGDLIDNAYVFGQMLAEAEDHATEEMTYAQFLERKTDILDSLGERERRGIEVARRQAASYVDRLGSDAELDVTQAANRTGASDREVSEEIEDDADEWETAFESRSMSDAQGTHNTGIADKYRELHGADARVFRRTAPGACKYCKELHIGPGGKPRTFKLSELESNGTNIGKAKSDWQAVVGPIHLNCDCTLSFLPPGWGFDDKGQMKFLGKSFTSRGNPASVLQKSKQVKHHVNFAGLRIAVESPTGSIRKWTEPETGKTGETTMLYDYGYVVGTQGARAEGDDEYDVFVGPDENAPMAYVVHQMKRPDFAEWDEDKAMIGFGNLHQAKAAYLAHYDNPRFFGSISMLPMEEFRAKVMNTRAADQDGMVKASAPCDPCEPQFTIPMDKASMVDPSNPAMSAKLQPNYGAMTSQAANRNTFDATGHNILFRLAPRSHAKIDPSFMRDPMEQYVEEGTRYSAEARKRAAQAKKDRLINDLAYDPRVAHPFEIPEMKRKFDETARKESVEMHRPLFEQRNARRYKDRKMSPWRLSEEDALFHVRPEMMEESSDKTGQDPQKAGVVRGRSVSVKALDKTNGHKVNGEDAVKKKHLVSPLETGQSVKVPKPGLGNVTLTQLERGQFNVNYNQEDHIFRSLSSACHHVWCVQKGYDGLKDFRKQNGGRQIPSGAGWKFWGLKPKEIERA